MCLSGRYERKQSVQKKTITMASQLLDGNFPLYTDGTVFGKSIAMSVDGTIMAVGNPLDDGGMGGARGSVRVYARDGSDWTQLGNPQLGNVSDDSGRYVALSSDGSVVAYAQNTTGSVLVLEWDDNLLIWNPRGGLVSYFNTYTDIKSISLSGDGTVLAVGLPMQNHVAVFKWTGATWTLRGVPDQLGVPVAISGANGSRFGYSVQLSADGATLAVGADRAGDPMSARGTARVFRWTGSTWTQRGSDIDGVNDGDWHGTSVALSSDGSLLAVGAPGFDSYRGCVRVFRWQGNTWTQRGATIEGDADSDGMGRSVALSADGGVLAVGAPHTGADGDHMGFARVFTWTANAWVQRGADAEGDSVPLFGRDICLSGDGLTLGVNQKNYI